ncbi:hypothetical protein TNCV_1900511 [Trichonephila clavipes]|nr:hypothetical protein TNCV_1900511 [Trichonephila clavipes]
MQVTVRSAQFHPNLEGEDPSEWSGASHLSSPSTNHTRGLVARRLFRVPPCRKGSIHLQTSMSSPGFEPSPYTTAVSVANHYSGWVTRQGKFCFKGNWSYSNEIWYACFFFSDEVH